MKNLIFLLTVLLISSKVLFSQSTTPDPDFWIADGPSDDVNSITVNGAYTYIGGAFKYVGQRTGMGIKMTTTGSDIEYKYPEVNAQINSVVSDGTGGFYIGGTFTKVGGFTRNRLAKINNDGNLDMTWNPNANNVVECLFFDGDHVYVGGQFTTVGGESRNSLARLHKTNGIADPFWSANTGTVHSLFVDNSNVFVGGIFNTIKGVARTKIAKLDKTTGDVDLNWIPNANNTVESISASLDMSGNATAIYAGGAFTSIGKTPLSRSRIAKIDNAEGYADGFWSADANGTVYVVKTDDVGNVYAGGTFTTVVGMSRSRIVKLHSDGKVNLLFNPGADDYVRDLAIDGNDIYVAGEFLIIDGVERNYIAKLDKSDGSADPDWIADVGNYAYCIGISGTNVYAGGIFKAGGNGARRNGLARIDNSDGKLDMNWDPHPNRASIYCLEIKGNNLYVGGYFDTISTVPLRNLARINLNDNIPDAGWTPDPNNPVNDIVFHGNDIIVAGSFTSIGGQSRYRIAKLNNSNGDADGSWDPNPNQVVYCIASDGVFIYAGGAFTNIGGQARNRIAKLNNTNGNAESWDPGANNNVLTIAAFGCDVYVGGEFTTIDGISRNRIAKLDRFTGTVDADWNPNADWRVRCIKPHGGKIYVGGDFDVINGISQYGIARVDIMTGIPDSWNPGLQSGVDEIEFNRRGDLFIIGNIKFLGGNNITTAPVAFRSTDASTNTNTNFESLSCIKLITMEVRSGSSPYNVISSSSSIGGGGLEIPTFFPNLIDNTPYYIVVKSTNTIETWSNSVSFTDGILDYDFTSDITQAYGSNMILKDGLWSFYTGDANQDGTVDLADGSLIDNDAFNFVSGNVPTDLNGDGLVDITDALFADNNAFNFISAVKP